MENFDIVIIGAGSAGCIVANQLISKTNNKILLIEAGPSDKNPIIKIPLGYGMTFYNKNLNWNFYSVKQKNLFQRKVYFPRGKVIGGSGSINAMVYTRGLKNDYKDWSNNENDIWSWQNILKTYETIEKKICNFDQTDTKNKIFVNDVSDYHHPILDNFFYASKEIGFNFNKNLNTNPSNQVGHYNINTRNGYRFTSSDGFLKPILNHPNLKVLKNSLVKKINIDKNKVSSIDILNNGKKTNIKANIGVISCAGSIMTPHLLFHSGIGPANHLHKFGIKVILDSPNVGKNLQDHIGIDYLYKSKIDTLNKSLGKWTGRINSFVKYLYNRSGPLSLSINQAGGFVNWKSKDEFPNIQLYFNPLTYSISYNNKRPLLRTDKFNGFIIGFNTCRPKSKGKIELFSNNFNDAPMIDPNYLDNEQDIHDLKCAFDIVRNISNSQHIKRISNGPVKTDPLNLNDKELIDHFKNEAGSVYHPCGTCRMDDTIQKGVVSKKLKVHGTDNLWIVDASVFPNIPSGNINAPVMMTAYNASQLIINDLTNIK